MCDVFDTIASHPPISPPCFADHLVDVFLSILRALRPDFPKLSLRPGPLGGPPPLVLPVPASHLPM
jgi:hypothetical protein